MFAVYGGNTERGIRERGIKLRPEVKEQARQIAASQLKMERRQAELARIKAERERLREEAKKRELAEQQRIADILSRYRCIEIYGRKDAKNIITAIASEYGFTYAEIIGPGKHQPLVKVRHACIRAVADERPDWSLPKIGREFGGRDHSSIIHALKKTAKQGEHWRTPAFG